MFLAAPVPVGPIPTAAVKQKNTVMMAVRIRTKIPLDFFIVLSLLFGFSQKQG